MSLLLALIETQPIPGVVWAHLSDFLLLQQCRTLLMRIDLLSYHQTFMILVLFWFCFLNLRYLAHRKCCKAFCGLQCTGRNGRGSPSLCPPAVSTFWVSWVPFQSVFSYSFQQVWVRAAARAAPGDPCYCKQQ